MSRDPTFENGSYWRVCHKETSQLKELGTDLAFELGPGGCGVMHGLVGCPVLELGPRGCWVGARRP